MLTATVSEAIEWQLLPLPIGAPPRVQEFADKGAVALREGCYEEALLSFAALETLKDVEGASYYSKLGMHLAGYAALAAELGLELKTFYTQILQCYPNAAS